LNFQIIIGVKEKSWGFHIFSPQTFKCLLIQIMASDWSISYIMWIDDACKNLPIRVFSTMATVSTAKNSMFARSLNDCIGNFTFFQVRFVRCRMWWTTGYMCVTRYYNITVTMYSVHGKLSTVLYMVKYITTLPYCTDYSVHSQIYYITVLCSVHGQIHSNITVLYCTAYMVKYIGIRNITVLYSVHVKIYNKYCCTVQHTWSNI